MNWMRKVILLLVLLLAVGLFLLPMVAPMGRQDAAHRGIADPSTSLRFAQDDKNGGFAQ